MGATESAPPAIGGDNMVIPNGRDPSSGRFLPGNREGKGNRSLRAIGALKRLLAQGDTLSADELRSVVRTLFEQAKAGSVTAAGILLDRCVGRARPEAPTFDPLRGLPKLDSAEGVAKALEIVTRRVAAGELPTDVGETLSAMIARTAHAGTYSDLERRLAALERGTT